MTFRLRNSDDFLATARASTVDLILATAIFRKCNIKP